MFAKSILPLFLVFSVAFASDNAPVFVFGKTNGVERPALSFISKEEFVGITKVENGMNVVFVEKNEKPDEFLSCTTKDGETCLTGLKSIQNKVYYRQVDSPIQTIKNAAGNCQVLNTNANGELVTPIKFAPNTCVIVNCHGTPEQHDALITKFIQENKDNKIVTVYTPNASLSRKTRAVSPDATYETNANPGFAIYFEKLQLCNVGADKITTCNQLQVTGLTVPESNNKTGFQVNLVSTPNIQFQIVEQGGYFEMRNLKVGDSTYRVLPPVQAPTTFSYYCGNKTFQEYGTDPTKTYTQFLRFENLQMQAPFNEKVNVNETFAFGDAWHCVPFVTIPILAGLFVVVILLTILAVGICWLMDINTMDRFDDPKGKTITINASE